MPRSRSDDDQPAQSDVGGRCAHIHDGSRCPYFGNWSDSTRGGPWFCRFHKWPDNRKEGVDRNDEFMRLAHLGPEARLEQVELWYGERNWRDEWVDAIVAANPDWYGERTCREQILTANLPDWITEALENARKRDPIA